MKELRNAVQAVILAGGLGTRLRAITGLRPKALVRVGDRCLLEWTVSWLESQGCRSVVLCLGYGNESIRSFVSALKSAVEFRFSVEASPLGTGGALRLALPLLEDTILVVNGDTIFQTSISPLLEFHNRHRADVTMALTEVGDAGRYGRVEISEDYRVRSFSEKAESGIAGWINAGVYVLQRAVIGTRIPPGQVSLEQDVFPRLIGVGIPFFGVPLAGAFHDVGTTEGYEQAVRNLVSG